MKKVSLFIAIFVLTGFAYTFHAHSAEVLLSEDKPFYHNARYDFSLELPPGKYMASESENSDGITIKDGKGFTLLAYGTRSYYVLEETFADAIRKTESEFDTVTDKKIDSDQKTFEITGLKGGNLIHIKCYFKEKHANFLRITHGQSAHDTYTNLCNTALKTFK